MIRKITFALLLLTVVTLVGAPEALAQFNISGFKINDTNGNGKWDSGEMGIENWNIRLLDATNGTQIANTSTIAGGFYQFMNLQNGTYNVTEETRAGFIPTNATFRNITVENMDVMNINFTNQQVFNISGFKINDANGNGVRDSGEMGIENWNIRLLNDTGTQIASTSTDGTGFYQFMNLVPGSYNLTEETRAGFVPTSSISKAITVENMDIMNVNFTNQQVFTISGFKINDANGNGVWDPGEMGIPGWNITLNCPVCGAVLANTTTDATGFYQFTNLVPGSYNLTEEMKPGFVPTSSISKAITVENMDVMNVNFTNQPIVLTTIAVLPSAATLNVNATQIITATALDQNDNPMAGINISWTSSNSTVGSVNPVNAITGSDGKASTTFTALAAGTVTVNATNGTVVGSATLNVTIAPVATFNISGFKINDANGNGVWDPGEMGIPGWNITLNCPVCGAVLANTTTDATGFYQFTNITNGTYVVTEEVKPGFTATNDTSMTVTVAGQDVMNANFTNQPIVLKTVAVSPSAPTLNVTETQVITATALDQNDNPMAGVNISWTVSNSTVGSVSPVNAITDSDGKASTTFTALTAGTAMVNATNGTVVGSANVIVTPVVVPVVLTTITVSPSTATLNANGTQVITATALDQNDNPMAGINIAWTSSNTTVGTVSPASATTDMNGTATTTFTALAPGTAMVNATNGTVVGSATVTVLPPVTNSISGFNINDLNGNGRQDQGEGGLPGWTISLTGIGVETSGIKQETTTDDQGFYRFENLHAGRYLIVETLQGNFVPSGAIVIFVELKEGENSMNNNFTNRPTSSLVSIPTIGG